MEQDDDVFVVLALLLAGGFGLLGFCEGLERRDFLVEGGEVLFDDEGELVDFDGPVVEEGFSFRNCDSSR